MNKHYFIALICTAVMIIIAVSVLHPVVDPNSDSVSYLKAIAAFDGGSGVSASPLAYRIIAAAGGLWTIIGLSKILGNYENAWMFMNILFFIGTVMFSYELVRRIHGSNHVALLSAMFVAGNYAMINYGLNYFMDAGGWMSYTAAALGVFMYARSGEQKNLWWAAVAVGLGGLFKEYAFLGALLIGLYLIYENWRSPLDFLRKVWKPALIVAVPTAILHGIVYVKYHYTYLDWLTFNQGYYIYASRSVEFIKAFGSLLNLLALLGLIGAFYFWKSRSHVSVGVDVVARNTWAFVICYLLSAAPILLWPAITQRILFISAPVVTVLASYLFKRFERRLYLFVPVLAAYILICLYMDAYVLNFVNLPF